MGFKQAAGLKVLQVKHHENTHAHAFKDVDDGPSHLLREPRPDQLSAIIILIGQEPSNVGNGEESGYDRVGAAFSMQSVGDFATLPGSFLSLDGPPCLNEQPDHQHHHQ